MPDYPINPDPQFAPQGFGSGASQTGIDSRIPKFFGYRSGKIGPITVPGDSGAEIATDGYFGPNLPWAFVGATSANENCAQPTLARTVPLGSFISIVSVNPDQFQAAVVKEIEADATVPAAQTNVVKPSKVIVNHWNWNF